MKNYLKGINQRIGNIFVNIRTLEELERKTGYIVDEEGNILEYNKNLKKVENFIEWDIMNLENIIIFAKEI